MPMHQDPLLVILLGLSDLYMSVNRPIIDLGNGFRHKANPWTNADLFPIVPSGTDFSEFFFIKLQLFLSNKYMSWSVVCEMSSILCSRFCVKGCLRRQDTTLNMCVNVVNDRSHKYVFMFSSYIWGIWCTCHFSWLRLWLITTKSKPNVVRAGCRYFCDIVCCPIGSRWAPCWLHEPCYQGYSSDKTFYHKISQSLEIRI